MAHRSVWRNVALGFVGTVSLGSFAVACSAHSSSGDNAMGNSAQRTDDGGDIAEGGMTSDDGSDPNAALAFSVDMHSGPARQFMPPTAPAPVSPYVYGINALDPTGHTSNYTSKKTQWGLVRKSGNSMTTWNWTNNYRNLGDLACYGQGPGGGGTMAAGVVTNDVDSVGTVQAAGAAFLAPVSIVDHVSAAVPNDTTTANSCPGSSTCSGAAQSSTGVNTNNLDFASSDPASTAFVKNEPSNPAGVCPCAPGAACASGCTPSTNPVYQGDFVAFMHSMYGSSAAPVFFSLDNEPNYWGGTHPEIWPFMGMVPCQTSTVTYDDIVSRDETYSAAIKAAWPGAKVFGPVVSQDGIIYAHSYNTDPHSPLEFSDYYLQQMAAASATAGGPVIDVFDVHYYNGQTSDPSQCVQNPRMFWDPAYTTLSPAATDEIDFAWAGDNGYFDTNWYPRTVIPRLLGKISAAYASGGGPGLSFSEYNSGCETSISGGVAEADDLGIFGREGVYAAAAMPVSTTSENYLLAAFDLYRNYDGNGALVGDTAVRATTNQAGTTSVYAFAHSTDTSKVDLVVINKSQSPSLVTTSIANAPSLKTANAYALVAGSATVAPVTMNGPKVSCSNGTCSVTYTMPPVSATTIALH